MILSRKQKPSRRAARLAVPMALSAVALLVTGSLGAGSAAAAESCGKKVIDDWYADGRVDGTYPPHCYDDAIEILPRDVRDYSSAKDDITRALQNRLNNKPAPPATTDPTPAEETTARRRRQAEEATTRRYERSSHRTTSKPGDDGGAEAASPLDTASADSIPVPLLVLGGLALLLVAAGSAGYRDPAPAGASRSPARPPDPPPTGARQPRGIGIMVDTFFRNLQDFLQAQTESSVRRSL